MSQKNPRRRGVKDESLARLRGHSPFNNAGMQRELRDGAKSSQAKLRKSLGTIPPIYKGVGTSLPAFIHGRLGLENAVNNCRQARA